jgi:hypothetical protein
MSDSIVCTNYDKKISNNVLICRINPGGIVSVSDIHISKGNGYMDAKYSLCPVSYEALCDFKAQTLNFECQSFKIGFDTNGNVSLKHIISSIVSTITLRLDLIKNGINNSTVNSDSFNTNDLMIITNGEITTYRIPNESHTMRYLLTRYVYDLDNNIKLVNSHVDNPMVNQMSINIIHPNPNKIMLMAIDNIKRDFFTFAGFFK